MNTVLDMRKAAATADKLAPDGSKYCHWGITLLDATDLDSAISRFLGSQIAINTISASKMWQVDSVAGTLINQLQMGMQECNIGVRFSEGARDVAVASKPVLLKFINARHRFARLAYEQTVWQERKNSRSDWGDRDLPRSSVAATDLLGAALEIRDAWVSVNKVRVEAATTKDCAHTDSPSLEDEPVDLNKLIDRLSRPENNVIPAADIWLVAINAEDQKLAVTIPLEACSYYSLDKKKAAKVYKDVLDSYHRMGAGIVKFSALALKQTESEEQLVLNIQEQ